MTVKIRGITGTIVATNEEQLDQIEKWLNEHFDIERVAINPQAISLDFEGLVESPESVTQLLRTCLDMGLQADWNIYYLNRAPDSYSVDFDGQYACTRLMNPYNWYLVQRLDKVLESLQRYLRAKGIDEQTVHGVQRIFEAGTHGMLIAYFSPLPEDEPQN